MILIFMFAYLLFVVFLAYDIIVAIIKESLLFAHKMWLRNYRYNHVQKHLNEKNANDAQSNENDENNIVIDDSNQKCNSGIEKVILDDVSRLKEEYPFADESLFEKFINNFHTSSIPEIKYIEEEIKSSHISNHRNQ